MYNSYTQYPEYFSAWFIVDQVSKGYTTLEELKLSNNKLIRSIELAIEDQYPTFTKLVKRYKCVSSDLTDKELLCYLQLLGNEK